MYLFFHECIYDEIPQAIYYTEFSRILKSSDGSYIRINPLINS